MNRTYSELKSLKTFKERFDYLKLSSKIGIESFGFNRYLNQTFYTSPEWKRFRRQIIIRDGACDLAMPDRELDKWIVIHHLNPITVEDVIERRPCLFDPENVVCTCDKTHKAIHYGDDSSLLITSIVRTPNDTCPWR